MLFRLYGMDVIGVSIQSLQDSAGELRERYGGFMGYLLDQINKTGDIKNIPPERYNDLAAEIRDFLIQKISVTGGHLASNLGVVELTMALHLCLNLPEDKIVWDVGHQSYTHKILTGRRNQFDTLRQYKGLAGFPKREESDCDCYNTGHSSTSISAALGMVKARELLEKNNTIVAVIGDGAMTGGEAYEAINNAARLRTNLIVILNDNNMSISENVGGFHKYLTDIRTSRGYRELNDRLADSLSERAPIVKQKISNAKRSLKSLVIPGMYFEDLGITYLGPVDGHNIREMVRVINEAKKVQSAVLIHVCTRKGNGYPVAERHPEKFHGTGAFHIDTGLPAKKKVKSTWSDIFSTVMVKLAKRRPDVVAITAAMADGVGLRRFRHIFPERFFDVGIAEQHAVSFAAGLAEEGVRPVVAIYSTFLQRAYDQVMEDVALQRLPVVFAIDRAGIVGADGDTHQGIYDLSYLSSIPGLTVMAPKNKWELADMLAFALSYEGPAAIRYPRGTAYDGLEVFREAIVPGQAEVIFKESGICLLAAGSMVAEAVEVRNRLKSSGQACSLVNARFVAPPDYDMVRKLSRNHRLIVTMEENIRSGGFGEHIEAFAKKESLPCDILNISIPDEFLEHGAADLLKKAVGIDEETVFRSIIEWISRQKE